MRAYVTCQGLCTEKFLRFVLAGFCIAFCVYGIDKVVEYNASRTVIDHFCYSNL